MITPVSLSNYRLVSSHTSTEVWQNLSTQHSLHASKTFNAGGVIEKFEAASIETVPSYLTVQIGKDLHITLFPEYLQYTNHSCKPNSFFNTTTMELVAVSAIEQGEEIRFFYPSSEWSMAQPFVCNCGHPECLQLINGAELLTLETLSKYQLTDFIQEQINHRR